MDSRNEATPTEDGLQANEGEPGKQPPTEEQLEELFGELTLEDEKKLAFKSKEELDAFIEKNNELFGKTGNFLRQSDYTRKTQELKTEREQFESEREKANEVWGRVKPDENSMASFGALWSTFQHGTPDIQNSINAFMTDVTLLSQGKQPTGPLSQGNEEAGTVVNPEVIQLRQKLADLEHKMSTGEERSVQRENEERARKAGDDWKNWVDNKSSGGVQVSAELEQAMVPYITALHNTNLDSNQKLDRAFKLASQDLGLSENLAVKKVISNANRAKSRTP